MTESSTVHPWGRFRERGAQMERFNAGPAVELREMDVRQASAPADRGRHMRQMGFVVPGVWGIGQFRSPILRCPNRNSRRNQPVCRFPDGRFTGCSAAAGMPTPESADL